MYLVFYRIGIFSSLFPAAGVTGAAYLSSQRRGEPRCLDDGGNLKTGNGLNMIAPRSMAGFAGNAHFDKGLPLRIDTGCMASGALFKPISFVRIVGKICLPLPVKDIILGGQHDQIFPLFFEILLLPLATQRISNFRFSKRSDFAGGAKIADIRQRFELDIPHHSGMKRRSPFQIGSFVALFTGFRADEGGTGSILIFAFELGYSKG